VQGRQVTSSPNARRRTVKVALGTDHAGFPLKDRVIAALRESGQEIVDCGAHELIPSDDYPDYTELVAQAILTNRAERGILVCGSGVGASIAANKFRGIRAALCHDCFSARQGVEDDDMNVLCLGARIIGPSLAEEVIRSFLAARFSAAERHARRVAKVRAFEQALGRDEA
jgi:ribose 5-phosphate isomerase B